MNATDKTDLVDGKYGICDLVDLNELRRIFERFTEATGFTIGFLDHPGLNVLIASGWRDICTKLHRACPISAANCVKSNRHLLDQLDEPGKLVVEACDNGLVDCAFPIIIKGKHIASLATGQLLIEEPDLERFRRQAELFGFDEQEYLRALAEVPVVPVDKLRSVTTFLGEVALVLSELGYARLTSRENAERLESEVASRTKAETELRQHRTHLEELVAQRTADLVKANDTVQQNETRFRAIFERSTIGKALTSPDGALLEVNQAFADMLGYTIAELQQTGFATITYPADLPQSRESVRTLLANECTSYRMEKRYVRKDGGIVWTDVSTTLLRDAGGAPLYFITSIADISERKRAEDKLGAAMADLKRSNQELEQFAYVASHDLQEPLRKVASFTQLLAERYGDKLDADAREFIAYAVDGAHRMQGLINDLLAYSRVGTRGRPLAPVDCEAIVDFAIANLDMAIQESGAVVTHEPLPTVRGDDQQLVQLFQNLIGNAIKFHGAEPPQVHISATRRDNDWLFRVRDNGIGIDPQYFGRLFVLFQRLHSRADYPGTGIGLAISKKVVERHGGRIWVESEPRKGSTFAFSIPAE